MAAVTIENWQREFCGYSIGQGDNYQHGVVSPLPEKPKTIFHQRYQTECQQTVTTCVENTLNPWTRAWLVFAGQQEPNTLQGSDESFNSSNISYDSDSTPEVGKRNRDSLLDEILNDALDLSMEMEQKRSRSCITEWQLEGSWDQTSDFHEETQSKTEEESANSGEQSTIVVDEISKISMVDHQQKKKRRFGVAYQIVPKYLKCPCCDYKSTSTSNFARHVHRTIKRYQCEICKKEFENSDNLRAHAKTHYQTALPYKCDVCGRGFVREATKSVHERKCSRPV